MSRLTEKWSNSDTGLVSYHWLISELEGKFDYLNEFNISDLNYFISTIVFCLDKFIFKKPSQEPSFIHGSAKFD